jgi:hypothetical protein
MALFSFLLMRLHRRPISQGDNAARARPVSSEQSFPSVLCEMTGTSSADMLWIMSTVIVDRMKVRVDLVVPPETFIQHALDAVESVQKASRKSFLDRVLDAISSGAVKLPSTNEPPADQVQQPAFCPVKSSESVINVLWKRLGIFFHDRVVHPAIVPGEETEVAWMNNNLVKDLTQRAGTSAASYQVLIAPRPVTRDPVPSACFSISSSIQEFLETSERSKKIRGLSARSSSSVKSLLPSRVMRGYQARQTGSIKSFDTLSDAMSNMDISEGGLLDRRSLGTSRTMQVERISNLSDGQLSLRW